jgi:hypothetical protein
MDEKHEHAVFYDNKNGKTTKLEVNESTLKGIGKNKRYVKSNLRRWRKCSWVIGTDHKFDCGLVNMQDRPTKSTSISDYNIMALSEPPLVSQLKPVLDDIEIAWLRFQDARANAVKDGFEINIAKLKNITDGGKTWTIKQILNLWKERGILLYQDSISGKYEGGRGSAVNRIPSTLIDDITEFAASWDHAIKRIEDMTGINALMLGATPDPNSQVTTQKMSVASSANALKPLALAVNAIKQNSAKAFMRRFILACRARKDIIKSYEGVIGRAGIERLISAERSMVDYGMTFQPRPTEQERAEMKQSVNLALQNRREGRPGIDLQTKMYIDEQINSGVNLKWIRFYLGFSEKRIAREDEERQKRLIEAQSQQIEKQIAMKNQSEAQKKEMDIKGDLAVEEKKGENDIKKEIVKDYPNIAEQAAINLGMVRPQTSNAAPATP